MNLEQINIWAIIPAGGIGKRMEAALPKQYLQIAGKTILQHSIDRLLDCDLVTGVVVGIAENDEHWTDLKITHARFLGHYQGGIERIHTVMNGLDFLQKNHAGKEDWVLVHDAVRPCVEISDIDRLIELGTKSDSGAILVNKVVDTVKKVNSDDQIQRTINRNELALAQTPQFFPIDILRQALTQALQNDQLSTDESAAVEALGIKPFIVEGSRTNIKITTPQDLELAKLIVQESL